MKPKIILLLLAVITIMAACNKDGKYGIDPSPAKTEGENTKEAKRAAADAKKPLTFTGTPDSIKLIVADTGTKTITTKHITKPCDTTTVKPKQVTKVYVQEYYSAPVTVFKNGKFTTAYLTAFVTYPLGQDNDKNRALIIQAEEYFDLLNSTDLGKMRVLVKNGQLLKIIIAGENIGGRVHEKSTIISFSQKQ